MEEEENPDPLSRGKHEGEAEGGVNMKQKVQKAKTKKVKDLK